MTAEKKATAFGWRVYGLGVMAIGMACLVFGEFDPGQPMPKHFPGRPAWAYAAGAFMVIAAAAIEWRRTAAWGAAALTVYYTLFVVILINGRVWFTDYAVYVTYEDIAMQLSIAAGGLLVYATTAKIDGALAARLTRVGQLTFGVCALVFGGAHFVYMQNTASMVPKWLPPTQEFWGYATGVGFVAAGIAILVSFGVLSNGLILLADHKSHWNWTESAVNLAVVGAAWVLADSLARPRSPSIPD